MDDDVRTALAKDLTIDLTTTGRHSGRPRRIEIWMLKVGDRIVITGTPGPRDWYANLCADGRCIETRGTKTVKQLHPCKARVKLFYWKPVVEYRDVYYYINCEPCNEADQQVALKGTKKSAS